MLVSVVMPYRDAEETIAEAIESILAQRDVELELIAIDDGSRDAGPQIARSIADHDPRVRLASAERRGLIAALEIGWRSARGAFIARMDADDVAHPDRLRMQLDAMSSAPDVAAMGAQVELLADEIQGG